MLHLSTISIALWDCSGRLSDETRLWKTKVSENPGHRSNRDATGTIKAQHSGTVPAIPGRLATMLLRWGAVHACQLLMLVSHAYHQLAACALRQLAMYMLSTRHTCMHVCTCTCSPSRVTMNFPNIIADTSPREIPTAIMALCSLGQLPQGLFVNNWIETSPLRRQGNASQQYLKFFMDLYRTILGKH